MKHFALPLILLCTVFAFALTSDVSAQRKSNVGFDEELYKSLRWRNIGPHRGGRSAAVTGVPGKPMLFYMGATGGGVWRTQDGGSQWENISDGFFGGSIGAITVSESDNNVIYVGGGEVTVRGNVSYGSGMWKSEDAGETWKNIGLKNARHIPRVRVHPKDPNIVYAAVLGDLYKSSEERGVYRSKDGGATWERILFASKDAGAVDLILDPNNPRVLYASTWDLRRTPYSFSSGGEGSALWKSTDGGNNWKKISDNEGFPTGTLGIIGVTVSPVNSQRVWAIAEAASGGVYRSDNGGKTWKLTNSDRSLRQRAWYYTRIYADTKDENAVYVLNVSYHKSTDGGIKFKSANAPHGDHHDLWIAPEDPNRMIMGDDGGAQVSYDGGNLWSEYTNQPTAQFYRVTTDNHFPYRIYGAQQDNSAIRISHRSNGSYITDQDWESTAGGESAHLAVDPQDNDIVYGGSYGGYLTQFNHANEQNRAINVWPDNPMGHGAEGMKYRFQWNFPVFFSPHDPKKLYTTSNHLHVSYDGGGSWEVISPDLTRNDSTKLGPSGGPITKDNTGVEYYATIFAAAESHLEKDLLWTGSDDGLIHVSKDGGKNWKNVTPSNMPEWMMINSMEIDPHAKGGLYVAGTRYKLGDYKPYLYHTTDYGKTWKLITKGIDVEHFTRVVRADPSQEGLLYAGTENGMYISFDRGLNWQTFQLNLPIVPITDLTIKNNNLIAATQGRSFWIIDDLTVLHQVQKELASTKMHLFVPDATYAIGGGKGGPSLTAGENLSSGVRVHYFLKEKPADSDTLNLDFLDSEGQLIRRFSNHPSKDDVQTKAEKGTQMLVWNMYYPNAEKFDGMILWWGRTSGPRAVPGVYKVRLTLNGESQEEAFEILADPRNTSTKEDLKAQFDFLMDVRNKLTEVHTAIKDIRALRTQMMELTSRLDEKVHKSLIDEANRMDSVMSVVETTLYQTQNRSGQDPLNFPIRLNNKLAHVASLAGIGSFRPTKQMFAFKEEVSAEIDAELEKWNAVKENDIPKFNQMVHDLKVDVLAVPKE